MLPSSRAIPGLLFLALLAGCGKPAVQGPPPAMEISVAVVPEREITEWDEYTGRLEAVNTVEIRPQVSGVLQTIAFTGFALVEALALLGLVFAFLFKG